MCSPVNFHTNANGDTVKAPNGFYDRNDGSIHIDLNAGNGGEGVMMFTVAHELTHFIKQWSPVKFKTLADFLVQQYGDGKDIDALAAAQQKKARTELTYDQAIEEFVADSMEAMLTDGTAVEKLAALQQQDAALADKIRSFLKNIAAKIRAVIDTYRGVEPHSAEGRYVASLTDALSKLEELYAEALYDASENFVRAETASGVESSDVKLMSRSDETTIKKQIVAATKQLDAMKPVASIQSDGFIGVATTKIVDAILKEYAKFGKQVDRQGFGIILLDRNQIDKAVGYLKLPGERAAMLALPRVLKRGIIIDSHEKHKERQIDSITFAAPVEINGVRGNVGAVVQSDKKTNRFKTLRILLPNGKAFEFVQNKEADSTTGSSSNRKGSEGVPIESASKVTLHGGEAVVKENLTETMDISVDEKTESAAPAILMSERTWTQSDYVQEREKAAQALSSALGVPQDGESVKREFADADIKYSIREEAPPKKTMEGYKVFVVKNGKLYPPMVANPNAEDRAEQGVSCKCC